MPCLGVTFRMTRSKNWFVEMIPLLCESIMKMEGAKKVSNFEQFSRTLRQHARNCS